VQFQLLFVVGLSKGHSGSEGVFEGGETLLLGGAPLEADRLFCQLGEGMGDHSKCCGTCRR
jgi:hypothetical protein